MTTRIEYLIATLTLLRDRLAPVVDELTFGEASPAGLMALAEEFELIAADLRQVAETPRVLDGDQVNPTHEESPRVRDGRGGFVPAEPGCQVG